MAKDGAQNTQKNFGKGRAVIIALGSVVLALFFFVAGWFAHYFSLGERARSLLWAIRTVENNYYKDVDEDKLYADIFDAFDLDPYSTYYTKEEYAAILSANEGNGTGIGISLTSVEANGKIRILRVAGNSPAEHAGLMDGMFVFRFGTEESSLTAGDTTALGAFIRERGAEEGFCLEAGFREDGADATVFTLKKGYGYAVSEVLYRDSVRSLRFNRENEYAATATAHGGIDGLPGDTAYVRIDAFYGYAPEEIQHALTHMKETGRTNLILDLRCNGGGYLSVFQNIAAHLMKNATAKKPVVASAKYKSGKVTNYTAPANDYYEYFTENSKVYILADENTASASECLIGALVSYGTTAYSDIFLREQGDGVAKTYGKGIMQSHYTDPQGNVLKLTSAEIFWPNDKSIHGVGVTKADGAIGIASTLLHGQTDEFLAEVIRRIAG